MHQRLRTCLAGCAALIGTLAVASHAPAGQETFSGCGTIVQGPECIVFEAEDGSHYALDHTGEFGLGDDVFVEGIINPVCFTTCLVGCIEDNIIAPCFQECGTLVQGAECVLFQSDSGTYFVENLGRFSIGDDVLVAGQLDTFCATPCQEGDGCILSNSIAPCDPDGEPFSGCGTLIQGAECILFEAEDGSHYILDNIDGFGIGDEVFIEGTLDPECATTCLRGDGCIIDNTIAPCDPDGEPFSGCGTIVQGPGCILFETEDGTQYLLEDISDFEVGDEVFVEGLIITTCLNPCFVACIIDNTIAPCDPDGEPFSGCGTLIQEAECILFEAEDGSHYILDNIGGFGIGDEVFIEGTLDPECATTCLRGDGCIEDNTIAPCDPDGEPFSGCGTLIQGAECILFEAEDGSHYILDNIDGFGIGDEVFIEGTLDPECATTCLRGDGCIIDNTIEPCCVGDFAPPFDDVGVPDLLALLGQWGDCPGICPGPPPCPADFDRDCTVGVPDLLELLSNWGPCE